MLTVKDAAQILNLSPALVYGLCRRGLIEHYRCGLGRGAIRIEKAALQAYLERAKVMSTSRSHSAPLRNPLRFSQLDPHRLTEAWRQQQRVSSRVPPPREGERVRSPSGGK